MRHLLEIVAAVFLIAVAHSCSSAPEGVIAPDDMVDLLVDVHMGEALTDVRYSDFNSDSARLKLRRTVLSEHGYTDEQFDTSLVWYGNHLDQYIKVYDRVIERLEEDFENAGNAPVDRSGLTGDSIDLWDEGSSYVMSRRSPSQFLNFRFDKDDNWKNGDCYTWKFKMFNSITPVDMGMFVDYTDGTTDIKTASLDEDGWKEMTVVLDSMRTPVSVYGYAHFDVRDGEEVFIDSLSLVRRRYDNPTYIRRYEQLRFRYGKD